MNEDEFYGQAHMPERWRRRAALLAVPLAAVVLMIAIAEDGDSSADVSSSCQDAFAEAARASGATADGHLRATLTACSSYEEWVQGLRDEPAALGLDGRADIEGPMEVANFCFDGDGPVCDDARAKGVID